MSIKFGTTVNIEKNKCVYLNFSQVGGKKKVVGLVLMEIPM